MQHRPSPSGAIPPTPSRPVLLRMPAVIRLTGLGRSTIYRLMAEAKFPQSVRLCGRSVAWRHADVEKWSDERPPSH